MRVDVGIGPYGAERASPFPTGETESGEPYEAAVHG